VSTRTVTPAVAAPVAVLTPQQRPMLQRTCDCGQHTGGGQCEGCKKKKKMPVQRRANGSAAPAIAPPIVHDALRSPGQPLEKDAQSYFASKFEHDFSHVRVHTDEQAAESARAVGSLAYTVGNHVVFGAGRYSPANSSGRRLLAHELTHVVQQQHDSVPSPQYGLEIGPSQDRYEREAEQVADRIVGGNETGQEKESSISPANLRPALLAPRLQRAEAADPAPGPNAAAPAFLVEDDALDLKPGRMKKGEFLDRLQASVCATADEVLSSVGRSAQGCPYIDRWIGHLRTKGSQFVERGIRKYAPDSAGVTKAEDYIPFVAARVRRGVARWARTGEITEVPDELKGQLLGANILAGVERVLSGIGGAIGGAVSAVARGVKKAASVIGGVFAKQRDGGMRDAGDPQEIQAQLRSGHPLEGGVKSRMETAFGGDFSHVRVHTDSSAAGLSARLNARAFTIGSDVAFGAGEYRPGTLIGDALIAHELAHVMQQTGPSLNRMSVKSPEYNELETDADVSAVKAVASIWGGAEERLARTSKTAMPRLRSGLGLRRCNKGGGGPCSVTETQTITTAKQTAAGWVTTALGKLRTTPVPAAVSAILQRNFGATDGVAANIPSIITKITTANTEMTTVPVSCAGTEDSTCAKAPCGYTPSAGGHAYVMCRNASLTPKADPIYQAGCVLHEAFHSAFADFTGDSYSGWGGHSGSTPGYPSANPLKNADSYTSVVIDLK